MASSASKSKSKSKATYYDAPLSANVSSVVDYDHEAYLQLVSGSGPGLGNAGGSRAAAAAGTGASVGTGSGKKSALKTANQVCREVSFHFMPTIATAMANLSCITGTHKTSNNPSVGSGYLGA